MQRAREVDDLPPLRLREILQSEEACEAERRGKPPRRKPRRSAARGGGAAGEGAAATGAAAAAAAGGGGIPSLHEVVVRALRPSFDHDPRHATAAGVGAAAGSADAARAAKVVGARIDDAFALLKQLSDHEFLIGLCVENGHFDPCFRPAGGEVAFVVGDVLQHRLFGRGVVYGWNETCVASDDWCAMNEIDVRLAQGRHQPFYQMFFSDGTSRYCSQENLSLDLDAKPVSNKRCAQVFPDGFDARAAQYVPSPELAARYPDDMRIIDERRQLFGCSGGGGGGGGGETEAAEQPTARSDQ